jgi:hypothetical protein
VNKNRAETPALTCGCGLSPATLVFNPDTPPDVLLRVLSNMLKDSGPATCPHCGRAIRIGMVRLDELKRTRNAWAVLHPEFAELLEDLKQYRLRCAKERRTRQPLSKAYSARDLLLGKE